MGYGFRVRVRIKIRSEWKYEPWSEKICQVLFTIISIIYIKDELLELSNRGVLQVWDDETLIRELLWSNESVSVQLCDMPLKDGNS